MRVAACTMVRNEEAHILEWIVYHRVIGFDALIVVDNASSDRTYNLVRSACASLPIHLIRDPSAQPDRQMRIYESVCQRYAGEFDWIAFLDGDEFLVPDHDATVHSMLEGRRSAVAVGWLIYGSNGHVAPPPGLVVENFRRRSTLDFAPNRHVKSIVQPRSVIRAVNPHSFAVSSPYTDVEGAAVEWVKPGMSAQPLGDRPWRINHYMTRSAHHWNNRLRRRQPGNNARNVDEFALYDRNEVLDPLAVKLAPRVKERIRTMGRLMPAM